MARVVVTVTIQPDPRTFEAAIASFESIAMAAANGGCDLIELGEAGGSITYQGMALTQTRIKIVENVAAIQIKATPSMILFIGWLMTALPARARVQWQGGWPFVTCPPNDDRAGDGDPTPLVPIQLART